MTRRTALTAAATAVLIGAGASTSAAVAPPPAVQCGDVIDSHVVLTADLVCPDSPVGLVLRVGATLDLAGHSVVGGGDIEQSPSGTGIEVPLVGGVEVRGGAIEGWAAGISVEQRDGGGELGRVRLDDLSLRANRVGLLSSGFVQGTPEFVITSSEFVENEEGILTWAARSIFLRSSRLVGNGTGARLTEGGGGMTLVDCEVADNQTGLTSYDSGFWVLSSVLRDNGTAVSGPATLQDSVVERNDLGIRGTFDGHLSLTGTVLQGNGTAVHLGDTFGQIADNSFVGNDVAFTATGDWAVVTLERNEFHGNGDAILSVGIGSILDSNTAVDNERWGIHAPGAVDLGGNQAWGNGNEPQCVGVVCGTSGPTS